MARPAPPGADVPMFPLGTVLLPGAYLPLHVFEPRYRELVRVCLQGEAEFGVTLIERGSEVGGGEVRFDAGCMARIVAAAQFDDGRWAIGTVGTRRVQVTRWLPDAPYPRAEVDDWEDPPAGPEAGRRRAGVVTQLRRVLALSAELGEISSGVTAPIDEDPVVASYQLAALAPVGPLDMQVLLSAPTPDERLELLARLLDEEEVVLARRLEGG
ncbi:MAG: LON peptidase substrate-binding domain-containing protein [Actinobacteria bacterium]|nr:LON peptidase substrate-binding domain-containing protein [Actinomycetota bacterium]